MQEIIIYVICILLPIQNLSTKLIIDMEKPLSAIRIGVDDGFILIKKEAYSASINTLLSKLCSLSFSDINLFVSIKKYS